MTTSRVHISIALETHEEHLLTSHHGLIGHTCGSPAHKQHAHGQRVRISPWDNKLTFSPFHSRQQRVTDQHRHEHRTDSTAPGHNWEHLCKQEHHHHSRVSIKSTLWGLKLNSPCRVILSPCHTGGEFGHVSGSNTDKRSSWISPFFCFFSPPLTWTKSSSGYGGQYPPAANSEHLTARQGQTEQKLDTLRTQCWEGYFGKCNRLQITSLHNLKCNK